MYRQRHPNGTNEMLAQLARHFLLPDAWTSDDDDKGLGISQQEQDMYRSWLYLVNVGERVCACACK